MICNDCYVSIRTVGSDARLLLFSDRAYGPYGGSILGFGVNVTEFGDTAGIYYRMIRSQSGASMWTLSISLVYPLLMSLLMPAMWVANRARRSPRGFAIESGQDRREQQHVSVRSS